MTNTEKKVLTEGFMGYSVCMERRYEKANSTENGTTTIIGECWIVKFDGRQTMPGQLGFVLRDSKATAGLGAHFLHILRISERLEEPLLE